MPGGPLDAIEVTPIKWKGKYALSGVTVTTYIKVKNKAPIPQPPTTMKWSQKAKGKTAFKNKSKSLALGPGSSTEFSASAKFSWRSIAKLIWGLIKSGRASIYMPITLTAGPFKRSFTVKKTIKCYR